MAVATPTKGATTSLHLIAAVTMIAGTFRLIEVIQEGRTPSMTVGTRGVDMASHLIPLLEPEVVTPATSTRVMKAPEEKPHVRPGISAEDTVLLRKLTKDPTLVADTPLLLEQATIADPMGMLTVLLPREVMRAVMTLEGALVELRLRSVTAPTWALGLEEHQDMPRVAGHLPALSEHRSNTLVLGIKISTGLYPLVGHLVPGSQLSLLETPAKLLHRTPWQVAPHC